MSRALIARFDVADEHRKPFESWLRSSFMSPGDVPGLDPDPVAYRAVRVPTRYRVYEAAPAYTVLFWISGSPAQVLGSDAFSDWWASEVANRFSWVTKQNWVVADQTAGPDTERCHDRVLLTQVHVPPEHEDDWERWYDERHIPQNRLVEGLFGETQRFRAFDVAAPRFHVSANPVFTQLVPIKPGADFAAAAASAPFLALIADTQSQWAGAIERAGSTIGELFS